MTYKPEIWSPYLNINNAMNSVLANYSYCNICSQPGAYLSFNQYNCLAPKCKNYNLSHLKQYLGEVHMALGCLPDELEAKVNGTMDYLKSLTLTKL